VLDLHSEQHDLYIRALKALDEKGMTAEHHKPATVPEEVALMHETNAQVTKVVVAAPQYRHGQYERIFEGKY
jgi:hypothetical protein